MPTLPQLTARRKLHAANAAEAKAARDWETYFAELKMVAMVDRAIARTTILQAAQPHIKTPLDQGVARFAADVAELMAGN